MNAVRAVARHALCAALLAAVLVPGSRGEDDVVKQADPAPSPPPAPALDGWKADRVIVLPGLRLQVGAQGRIQVQGGQVQVQAAPAVKAAPEGEVRREAYLGVVTGAVAPAVRAQLDLPEGVGLSIDAVAADSPAEKAGVRQYDVIHKFNDQVICSAEQLSTLVKVVGAGTTVPLTLVRGGHEKVVEAVLEERAVATDEVGEAFVQVIPNIVNLQQAIAAGAADGFGAEVQAHIERRMADIEREVGDIEQKVNEAHGRAGGGMLQGLRPGGVGNVRTQTQVLTIGPNAQSATTVVSDARGTVEIRSADGKKTVTVNDPSGKEVYSGPLDSDDDMDKVPEGHRDWVREANGGLPAIQPPAPEAEETKPESGPDAAEAAGPTT